MHAGWDWTLIRKYGPVPRKQDYTGTKTEVFLTLLDSDTQIWTGSKEARLHGDQN
jgi:hypothetical protein